MTQKTIAVRKGGFCFLEQGQFFIPLRTALFIGRERGTALVPLFPISLPATHHASKVMMSEMNVFFFISLCCYDSLRAALRAVARLHAAEAGVRLLPQKQSPTLCSFQKLRNRYNTLALHKRHASSSVPFYYLLIFSAALRSA